MKKKEILTKELTEERLQWLKEERARILEKVKDPKISQRIAKKIVIKRYPLDHEMHEAFLSRDNITKKSAISFGLKIQRTDVWFMIFNNPKLSFSVPELIYWAIEADGDTNHWLSMFQKNPNPARERSLGADFSVLGKILQREDVLTYIGETSSWGLILLARRLKKKRVWIKIFSERDDVFDIVVAEKNLIVRLIFLITDIVLLPLSIVNFLKVDKWFKISENTKLK